MFGFFKKKKKKIYPKADLSVLKTDVHSHLIPGIDDGAQTMEDTIALLKGFVEWGYTKVITTPHIMSDYYKNTPEIILNGLEHVREAIKTHNIPIEIEAAAEYYLDDDLMEKIKSKNILTFGDKYFLFEFPFFQEPPNVKEIVFELQMSGYKPVLAHPERYTFWYNDFSKYTAMYERGVKFQLNWNSLTGYYSPETRKIAQKLIDNNMIDFIGSDCHRLEHQDVMDKARSDEYLYKLLESGKLLNSTL